MSRIYVRTRVMELMVLVVAVFLSLLKRAGRESSSKRGTTLDCVHASVGVMTEHWMYCIAGLMSMHSSDHQH